MYRPDVFTCCVDCAPLSRCKDHYLIFACAAALATPPIAGLRVVAYAVAIFIDEVLAQAETRAALLALALPLALTTLPRVIAYAVAVLVDEVVVDPVVIRIGIIRALAFSVAAFALIVADAVVVFVNEVVVYAVIVRVDKVRARGRSCAAP